MSGLTVLGDTLLNCEGDEVPLSILGHGEENVVALYFAASWCPPCRMFTPRLVETVATLKKTSKPLQVVFVSSDRSKEEFDENLRLMSDFLVLPLDNRSTKENLVRQFNIKGIPCLVILDSAGNLINRNACHSVCEDPNGFNFPWRLPSFQEALGTSFCRSNGETVDSVSTLEGKVLGIFFAAEWCPPCRGFSAVLIEAYKRCQALGKQFEVIYASSDRSEKQFGAFFAQFPWLAIPYSDRERHRMLCKHFDVSGIPSLVLVDHTGAIINSNARAAVAVDPAGEDFPWAPSAVCDLELDADGINDSPSIVLLLDGCPPSIQAAGLRAIMSVATAHGVTAATAVDSSVPYKFFFATGSNGVVDRVAELCKLSPSNHPQLLLFDIPDKGGFYMAPISDFVDEAGATAALHGLMAAYEDKTLKRRQLRG